MLWDSCLACLGRGFTSPSLGSLACGLLLQGPVPFPSSAPPPCSQGTFLFLCLPFFLLPPPASSLFPACPRVDLKGRSLPTHLLWLGCHSVQWSKHPSWRHHSWGHFCNTAGGGTCTLFLLSCDGGDNTRDAASTDTRSGCLGSIPDWEVESPTFLNYAPVLVDPPKAGRASCAPQGCFQTFLRHTFL